MESLLDELLKQQLTKVRKWEHEQEIKYLSTALMYFGYPFNYDTCKKVALIESGENGIQKKQYLLKDTNQDHKLLELHFYHHQRIFDLQFNGQYICQVVYHIMVDSPVVGVDLKWFEEFIPMPQKRNS